ncbi:uncharacterized protein LOC129807068 isoform X2 [Phlebotomus papatasi]|uniref:uncharacterized protein LOC129807068 isoform X2 n=1 Tax=Phlebotomus papatasi TaxID=29031 RepID=UPI00248365E8|nr:uncharacterized protein LOC129807068 isoform X2 [Phlebotomus papatasi]
MASGGEKRWIGSGVFNPQSGVGSAMPEWKKELIQRRKNLAKCMTAIPGHSHSQQCHGTTAANSTQIHRQVGTTGMRIGGGGTAGQQQQHRGSGSTVGECRATVQSSCERDGVRVSQAVASNGSSCVATKCCHEDILCEVHQSGRNNNNNSNINSSSNLSSGGDFNSDSRDIVHFCDNRQLDDKMVAVQEMCGEKLEYDTSEELKYGAGIVSKLVSRFMSYTMRVSAAKERPSLDNLRRATSLNNLLDDDNEVVEVPQRKNENETVAREMMGDGKVVIDDVTVDTVNSGGVNCDKGIYRHSRPQMGTYQHSEIMRRRQMGRGNDSLKRARSVDALLRVENRSGSGGGGGMMVDQDVAQDAIVEENSSPANGIMPPINADSHVANICDVVTIEDKIVNARERGEAKPKRLKSFMEDPERPPPDLVKTTLRIFEATANRRGRPPTCRSGEVAAKVASFKSIISQEKPAILYPKPPVSPKKALVGKNVRCSSHRDAASNAAVATTVTARPATVVQEHMNNNSNNNNNNNNSMTGSGKTVTSSINVIQRSPSPLAIRMDMTYRSVKNFSPTSPQSPKPDLINVSPPRRQQQQQQPQKQDSSSSQQENGMTMGSESLTIAQLPSKIQSMKIESTAAGHQVSSQATSQVRKVPVRSGTVSSTTEESDTDSTDSFDDDLVDGDEGNNYHHSGGIKRISKGELENISRAGATTEFNFGSGCTSTPIRDKSHLPSLTNGVNLSIQLNSPEDTADDIGRQQQQQQQEVNYYGECVVGDVNGGVKMVEKSPENGVVNEESVDKVTVETKEIVDMTQCSGEKQLTNQEIEKNMINREKSETNVTQVVAAPKWTTTKKKPWKEEPQNTTMVFNFSNRKDVPDYIENDGVVLRRRREMPKPGESGFVLLGDAPLETSTDPDDSWTMGPPSPCDVDFSNDNVIINGKSSLRHKPGDNKQWKIRFDDSLTSTYEYPSESSQREEMLSVASNGKTGLMDDKSFNSPAYQKFLPLGLAPLGNYTPVKGGALNSDFELGVKRNSPVVESPGSATGGNCAGIDQQPQQQQQQVNGDLESLQYLKPATDEQTVAWSEGTRVTDLLF